jgi:hypothetical protein
MYQTATPQDSKQGKVMVGTENLASATGLLWTTVTLGSLTCEEGGNLSTQDLSFIYVSSEGRVVSLNFHLIHLIVKC